MSVRSELGLITSVLQPGRLVRFQCQDAFGEFLYAQICTFALFLLFPVLTLKFSMVDLFCVET